MQALQGQLAEGEAGQRRAAAAEALSYSGLDWMCIDIQHGLVGYAELGHLLSATKHSGTKRIVRVGGPTY
jgi:2-keto-3-deoxy-L-rhamnonate aldolase RhmA